MPATLLRAQLTDKELTLRTQARAEARRALPNPAATARALALAICEVEAGLRSASQLERICHPSLWDAIAHRIQRAGGPPAATSMRVARLVERAMAYAVEEYDDDLAVARLVWLAHDDQVALDQACDICLSYTDIDLGIRGRAIGLLARVLYPDIPFDPAANDN